MANYVSFGGQQVTLTKRGRPTALSLRKAFKNAPKDYKAICRSRFDGMYDGHVDQNYEVPIDLVAKVISENSSTLVVYLDDNNLVLRVSNAVVSYEVLTQEAIRRREMTAQLPEIEMRDTKFTVSGQPYCRWKNHAEIARARVLREAPDALAFDEVYDQVRVMTDPAQIIVAIESAIPRYLEERSQVN